MITAIDWSKVPPRRELMLFIGVAAAMFLFFFQGVYLSRMQDFKTLQSKSETLQREREALLKFVEMAPAVASRSSSVHPSEKVQYKILQGTLKPYDTDLTSLLTHITAPAFLRGIRVLSFSYQQGIKESGFSHTDFTLEISGPFVSLMNYLERMEQFPALFHVRDVVLSHKPGDGGELQGEIACRFFKID